MKKLLVVATAALLFWQCTSDKKEANFTLTGHVNGIKKGTLYVKSLNDTLLQTRDSVVFNGQSGFRVSFPLDEPEMLYLFLDRGKTSSIDNSLMVFAEPGQMTLETTLETFYAGAQVTGSENHDKFEAFKKGRAQFVGRELDLEVQQLEDRKNGQTISPELVAQRDGLVRRRYLYTVNFALNNSSHAIAPYLALSQIPNAGLRYLDTINASLTPEISGSKYGKLLQGFIEERRQEEQ